MTMWKKTNLIAGIVICVVFASLVFTGVKSPFGAIGQAFAGSGSSGRGGSGIYYYGGGK